MSLASRRRKPRGPRTCLGGGTGRGRCGTTRGSRGGLWCGGAPRGRRFGRHLTVSRRGPRARRRIMPGLIGMAVREASEDHLTDRREGLGSVLGGGHCDSHIPCVCLFRETDDRWVRAGGQSDWLSAGPMGTVGRELQDESLDSAVGIAPAGDPPHRRQCVLATEVDRQGMRIGRNGCLPAGVPERVWITVNGGRCPAIE